MVAQPGPIARSGSAKMEVLGHGVAEQIRRDAELARRMYEDEMDVDADVQHYDDGVHEQARGRRRRDRPSRGGEQRSQPRKDAARAPPEAARLPARREGAHIREQQDEEYLQCLRRDQEREAAEQHARQQMAEEEKAAAEYDEDDEDTPLSLADMRQARLAYFARLQIAA